MLRRVDAAEQLYLALQHAARRFRELDDEVGLSPARFSLLATLRYHGPLRVGELAREERVAQPTVTQSVQGLESAGLVRRGPHPTDGRGSVVEPTPAGRAVVRRARARKIAWLSEVIGELDDDQRAALGSAAARLDHRSLQRLSPVGPRYQPCAPAGSCRPPMSASPLATSQVSASCRASSVLNRGS